MRNFIKLKEHDPRVRVAILDSGIDMANPHIKEKSTRIRKCRSFVNKLKQDEDSFGHGTYTANLLLTVAPFADLYIARVCNGAELVDATAPDSIAMVSYQIVVAVLHELGVFEPLD